MEGMLKMKKQDEYYNKYYIDPDACDGCELCAWSSLIDFSVIEHRAFLRITDESENVQEELMELWHDCPSGAFRIRK